MLASGRFRARPRTFCRFSLLKMILKRSLHSSRLPVTSPHSTLILFTHHHIPPWRSVSAKDHHRPPLFPPSPSLISQSVCRALVLFLFFSILSEGYYLLSLRVLYHQSYHLLPPLESRTVVSTVRSDDQCGFVVLRSRPKGVQTSQLLRGKVSLWP